MKFEVEHSKLKQFIGKYCPCRALKFKENVCPCEDFINTGNCVCGLFKKVE